MPTPLIFISHFRNPLTQDAGQRRIRWHTVRTSGLALQVLRRLPLPLHRHRLSIQMCRTSPQPTRRFYIFTVINNGKFRTLRNFYPPRMRTSGLTLHRQCTLPLSYNRRTLHTYLCLHIIYRPRPTMNYAISTHLKSDVRNISEWRNAWQRRILWHAVWTFGLALERLRWLPLQQWRIQASVDQAAASPIIGVLL